MTPMDGSAGSSTGSRVDPAADGGPALTGLPLQAAYVRLSRLIAPLADAEAAVRAAGDGGWDADGFLRACAASGLEGRAVEGPVGEVLKPGRWAVLELAAGGWIVARRTGARDVLVRGTDGSTPVAIDALKADVTGRGFQVSEGKTASGGEYSLQDALHGHWFWSVIAQYRRSFAYVALASLLVNVLALAGPLFIMNVYDRVFPNAAFSTLWVLAAGVLAAIAFEAVLRLARAGLIDAVGRRVDYRVSGALFEKILATPLLGRGDMTGAYISRFTAFELVRDFFTSATVSAIVDLFFVVIFLAVIFMVAGPLVLAPVAGLIFLGGLGFALQGLSAKAAQGTRDNAAARHSLLFDTVSAMESVKSLRAERTLTRRWKLLVQSGARLNEQLRRHVSIGMAAAAAVQQLMTVCLVIGGAYLFSAGNLSLGAVIAVVMLSGRAFAPVGGLAVMIGRARQAFSALKGLDVLMDQPEDSAGRTVSRPVERGEIRLEEAGFRFAPDGPPVLAGLNLTIRPGERVGLIGKVGSGKTSLCRVLAGLYPPDAGLYRLDGLDARQYAAADLRKAVRLVGADAALFSGTVRDNLAMADPGAENAALRRAVEIVGLSHLVDGDEAGFDRDVGERGDRLSSGQQRLLALARAFVDPFRVLILDEPTANLDRWSEQQLCERLREALAPDQTLILSTHRFPMLELVDRLIVLDAGRIVMDGPRAEVIAALEGRKAAGPDPDGSGKSEPAGEAAAAAGVKTRAARSRAKPSGKTPAKTAAAPRKKTARAVRARRDGPAGEA